MTVVSPFLNLQGNRNITMAEPVAASDYLPSHSRPRSLDFKLLRDCPYNLGGRLSYTFGNNMNMRIKILSFIAVLIIGAIVGWLMGEDTVPKEPTVIYVSSEGEAMSLIVEAGGAIYSSGHLPSHPPTLELRAMQDGRVIIYRWIEQPDHLPLSPRDDRENEQVGY